MNCPEVFSLTFKCICSCTLMIFLRSQVADEKYQSKVFEVQRISAAKTKDFLRALSGSILLNLLNKVSLWGFSPKTFLQNALYIFHKYRCQGLKRWKIFHVLFESLKRKIPTPPPWAEIVGWWLASSPPMLSECSSISRICPGNLSF